jgi:tRNA pseudouridine55 synthase
MGRRKGLPIDGVLLLDKPRGLSSNTALQRARRALGAAKAGHTGTLDPMATGLLPVAFGEATKFSQYLLDADKAYLAEVRLGLTTDTGDAEGQVIACSDIRPSAQQILEVCARFVGEMAQLPPMYSALKRDGKALYEYARAGMEVERQARRVAIHAIEVVDMAEDSFRCRIRCSKGTYIRVLAEDIGKALGCGAHLMALARESTGAFELKDAVCLAQFEAMPQEARLSCLLPADSFVRHLPVFGLSEVQASRICHGQGVEADGLRLPGLYRLYLDERFLGLGSADGEGSLTPQRLLATTPAYP